MSEFKLPYNFNPKKKDIANAIVIIGIKYRLAHNILAHESLTVEEVGEILEGVKMFFYELEEIDYKIT